MVIDAMWMNFEANFMQYVEEHLKPNVKGFYVMLVAMQQFLYENVVIILCCHLQLGDYHIP